MAFSIRPFRRFPGHCFVALQCEASPRQRHNLESFFTLPNEQCIESLKRSCGGRGGRSLPWRIFPSSRTPMVGSNIT